MISALLGLVPWYGWLVAVLVLVALTYLGLWPLVIGFLRRVPREVWIAAGCITALVVIHLLLVKGAVAREHEAGQVALVAQRATFQKQIQDARDVAQKRNEELEAQNVALQMKREESIKSADVLRRTQVAALKKGFAKYVSTAQRARCPDVPRGFLLYGADAAAYANGGGEALRPAPASTVALDPPSGVPLDALADTVAEQAGAYRSCRQRVSQWEQWAADVDAWFSSLQSIFKGSHP